jgi:hypothetical protein
LEEEPEASASTPPSMKISTAPAGSVIVEVRFPSNLSLKGLSHEIDFKNFDKNLQTLA